MPGEELFPWVPEEGGDRFFEENVCPLLPYWLTQKQEVGGSEESSSEVAMPCVITSHSCWGHHGKEALKIANTPKKESYKI